MDHTTLIALAALSANLKHAKFHRLDAHVLSNGTHLGGVLQTQTTVAFGKPTKSEEWVCTVSVKVTGYPKGTTKDDVEEVAPIFSVEATVKGVYYWQITPAEDVLSDPDLTHALGRSLYALAASECQAASAKIGFHEIRIPADLPRAGTGEALPVTEDDLLMIESGLVAPPPKPKVGTPRKTAPKRRTSPKAK